MTDLSVWISRSLEALPEQSPSTTVETSLKTNPGIGRQGFNT
jgi:hypothetical protein